MYDANQWKWRKCEREKWKMARKRSTWGHSEGKISALNPNNDNIFGIIGKLIEFANFFLFLTSKSKRWQGPKFEKEKLIQNFWKILKPGGPQFFCRFNIFDYPRIGLRRPQRDLPISSRAMGMSLGQSWVKNGIFFKLGHAPARAHARVGKNFFTKLSLVAVAVHALKVWTWSADMSKKNWGFGRFLSQQSSTRNFVSPICNKQFHR